MKTQRTIIAFVGVLLLGVPGLWAQTQAQQDSSVPPGVTVAGQDHGALPAARGVSGPDFNEPYVVPQTDPDTHALSGAESFSVGSLGGAQDIVGATLFANQFGRTGIQDSTGQTRTESISTLGGTLNFNRSWNRSRFMAYYNGAALLGFSPSTSGGASQRWYQDLTVEQVANLDRWALMFRNDLVASPQATFGGQALGGPGQVGQFSPASGVPLGALNPGFGPGDSILTAPSMRIGNATIGEADYSFSRRTMITFSGSYGLLHFLSPGYIDSHQVTGQLGYDYSLSPMSTLALIASYNHIAYTGSNAATESYLLQLAYGKKITGRLAFQIAGGPERVRFRDPIAGTGSDLNWSLNSALTYQLRRTTYSLSYVHQINAGSGVFYGSRNHIFTATAHRNLTRFWLAGVNVGYTVNESVVPVVSTASQFDSWYAGANLSRQISRTIDIAFNYGIQKQQGYGGNICLVASCGNNTMWQTFGMTFTWRLRPFVAE